VANDCSFIYNLTKYPFSYNLSSLALEQDVYKITDKQSVNSLSQASSAQLSILFNFCTSVPSHLLPPACEKTAGTAGEICSSPETMAFVYSDKAGGKSTSCKRLNGCIEDRSDLTVIDLHHLCIMLYYDYILFYYLLIYYKSIIIIIIFFIIFFFV
jgi:hypothetical protein